MQEYDDMPQSEKDDQDFKQLPVGTPNYQKSRYFVDMFLEVTIPSLLTESHVGILAMIECEDHCCCLKQSRLCVAFLGNPELPSVVLPSIVGPIHHPRLDS